MEPKERLQVFLTAMMDWELWCHAELRKTREDSEWKKFSQAEGLKPEDRDGCDDRRTQEVCERLEAIFTEFLTRSALEERGEQKQAVDAADRSPSQSALEERSEQKPYTINYAKPPRHDQEIEAEYEQKGAQAYLYTQPRPRGIFRTGKVYDLDGPVSVYPEGNLYVRRKYVMEIENGVWRIDAFFDWNPFSNTWSKPQNLSIQPVFPPDAPIYKDLSWPFAEKLLK